MWPEDPDALVARQLLLARAQPPEWTPPTRALAVAGCWACFPRGVAGPGQAGDPTWGAAVVTRRGRVLDRRVVEGAAGAPYTPGLLALRVGRLLDQVTRALTATPDVLLVDGTGRDHPRGAGLALHLGAELGLPTVGVTHRPLVAEGPWPGGTRGAVSPLRHGDRTVGCWVRVRAGLRPLAVHPGWGVDLDTAVALVLAETPRHRTPEPLRLARHAARAARALRASPAGGAVRLRAGEDGPVTTTRFTRRLRAPRARVYRALLDPETVARWRVPAAMSCQVHELDAREGGAVRVSLTYADDRGAGKTAERTDTYHGRFQRLVPERLVVEVDEFETADPALQGPMTMTISLADRDDGTELTAVHEGLPPGLAPADNEAGWNQALDRLAALVEGAADPQDRRR
jgi:deoxyribonuclease V